MSNADIQSRREFFRNLFQKALPIISGVVLSEIPIVGNAMGQGWVVGLFY